MANIITTPQVKEEILMPEEDKKLLKELYLLRSYSGFEEPVRKKIMAFLDLLHIPYLNYNGNVLGFNHPKAPLFSAHMDMVNTEGYKLKGSEEALTDGYVFTLDNKACIRLYRDREKKVQTSLGADDKNGIWVILTLLKRGYNINFAFCHSEEIGGAGSDQIIKDKECGEFIRECQYCVVIDRKNAHDIIGYENDYCLAMDDRLEAFAKEKGYKFKPERGSISDANRFSTLVECVNLSCGYYEPHTSKEYTNLNELYNTLLFCEDMLKDFNYHSVSAERMQKFKKCSNPYSMYTSYKSGNTTYHYPTYRKDEEKDEDDDIIRYRNKYGNQAKAEEKKTSEEKTSIRADGTDTTIFDADESLVAFINKYYAEEALDTSCAYSEELKSFIVPIYTDEYLPEGTKPEDIVAFIDCACGKQGMILQDSVDALYLEYYNSNIHGVLGFCSHCGEVRNLAGTFKYLQ